MKNRRRSRHTHLDPALRADTSPLRHHHANRGHSCCDRQLRGAGASHVRHLVRGPTAKTYGISQSERFCPLRCHGARSLSYRRCSGAVIKRRRPDATSVRRHSRTEERPMVSLDHGAIEQPSPVAAVDESPDLLVGEPDEVALADQPFTGKPGSRLGPGSVRPGNDDSPRRGRAKRKVLDRDDLDDDADLALAPASIGSRKRSRTPRI